MGGNCVEVGVGVGVVVPVRDSKEPGGGVVVVPASAWAALVVGLARG
jgi:hypothetical protein